MGFEGTTLWRVRRKVGTDLLLWPGASVTVVGDDGRCAGPSARQRPVGGAGRWRGGGIELRRHSDHGAARRGGPRADRDLVAYACISRVDNHLETYPNGDVTHYFGLWFVLRGAGGERLTPDGEEMGEVAWVDVDRPPRLLRSTALARAVPGGPDPGGSRSTDRGSEPPAGAMTAGEVPGDAGDQRGGQDRGLGLVEPWSRRVASSAMKAPP